MTDTQERRNPEPIRCTCPLDPDDPEDPFGAREVIDSCPIHGSSEQAIVTYKAWLTAESADD